MSIAEAPAQVRANPAIEVRPDGVVPIRLPGRDPYRVLLFGGGVLTGWGLLDHDRGLPGHLGRRLNAKTSRGVDLDVVVNPDPLRADSLALLKGMRVARYDALVVVLGERASLDNVRRSSWTGELEGLLAALTSSASNASAVLVVDSAGPMVAVSATGLRRARARSRAAKLAASARRVCEGSRIAFEELSAPPTILGWGRQFSTSNYRTWADEIVAPLRAGLERADAETGAHTAASVRERQQDERYRQRAVESLRLSSAARDPLLDAVVMQAKATYRAASATFTVVDGDMAWARAGSSSALWRTPRGAALADVTIRSDEPTVIENCAEDPRSADGALEVAGSPIGFYAAVPVHTVDGYRIGALEITDTKPRAMHPDRLAELHVMAGRIERELWARVVGAHA